MAETSSEDNAGMDTKHFGFLKSACKWIKLKQKKEKKQLAYIQYESGIILNTMSITGLPPSIKPNMYKQY